jgi:hypothetical protein
MQTAVAAAAFCVCGVSAGMNTFGVYNINESGTLLFFAEATRLSFSSSLAKFKFSNHRRKIMKFKFQENTIVIKAHPTKFTANLHG